MSFVSMWKASGVQQGKRFTLPLKGEALSPKTLVDCLFKGLLIRLAKACAI